VVLRKTDIFTVVCKKDKFWCKKSSLTFFFLSFSHKSSKILVFFGKTWCTYVEYRYVSAEIFIRIFLTFQNIFPGAYPSMYRIEFLPSPATCIQKSSSLLCLLSLAYPILYFGFFFSHLYFGFVVQCLWDTEVYCLAVWSLMVRRWLRHIQSVINSMFDVNHMEYAVSNLNKQKKIDTCREAIMPTAFVLQLRVVSHWFISVTHEGFLNNKDLRWITALSARMAFSLLELAGVTYPITLMGWPVMRVRPFCSYNILSYFSLILSLLYFVPTFLNFISIFYIFHILSSCKK
jgi:hypothetical protein